MKNGDQRVFSVLLNKTEDELGESWWVAQCLEHDIVAQARQIRDALHEISRMLVGRLVVADQLGVDPFDGIPAAPREMWDEFEKGSLLAPTEESSYAVEGALHSPALLPSLCARVS